MSACLDHPCRSVYGQVGVLCANIEDATMKIIEYVSKYAKSTVSAARGAEVLWKK